MEISRYCFIVLSLASSSVLDVYILLNKVKSNQIKLNQAIHLF